MADWDKVGSDIEKGPGGLFKWIVITVVALFALFFGLRSIGLIGGTVVERAVFENSYQKKSSDNARIAAYESQLATARFNLTQATDPATQRKIAAQVQLLETQLETAQRLANN